MDKTTKVFISLVGGLAFFVITKELILSLIISVWLLFALFSLAHQIFLFFSIFSLFYYLVFKTISFVLPAIMVVLGLILVVLPKIDSGQARMTIKGSNKFLPDTRIIGFLLLLAFFLFALLFSYQTFQKQQQVRQEVQKEKPPEKIIINLK